VITVLYHVAMSTSAVPRLDRDAVLIPVKAFDRAKLRLAAALTPLERRRLAIEMAGRVVLSASKLTVAVVCDDEEVAAWASELGALVLWEPGRGLNGAVQFGFERLRSLGVATVAVVASDLPLADDIGWVTRFRGITLVPDRREDGTNVISVPPGVPFSFSYGPQSFKRHRAEALRANVAIRVVHDSPLAWDVDVPDDLGVLTR
jgi:2-phospho-L-lactate guanylyltransferase